MSTTKHNLSTRKYQKSQPVEFKFIDHYISILRILFDGNKNVNQIFNTLKEDKTKTIPYQSDKDTTISAIKYLLKYQLVKETDIQSKTIKRKTFKKQKRIIELTSLGSELSKLIYFIDDYGQKFKELKEKINYHFDISQDTISAVKRSRLGMRGWNSQEIDIYDKLESEIFSLETHLPLVILSALLSRYLGIIFHYNPLNDIAKEIEKDNDGCDNREYFE